MNCNESFKLNSLLLNSSKRQIDSVKQDVPEYQGDEHFIVRKKVEYAFEHLGKPVVVEDTSMQIECLQNLPGKFSGQLL